MVNQNISPREAGWYHVILLNNHPLTKMNLSKCLRFWPSSYYLRTISTAIRLNCTFHTNGTSFRPCKTRKNNEKLTAAILKMAAVEKGRATTYSLFLFLHTSRHLWDGPVNGGVLGQVRQVHGMIDRQRFGSIESPGSER